MAIDIKELSDSELELLASGDKGGWARVAAQKHGVPEYLIDPIIKQESGGDQSAVSPKGARGVMQLMPGTARSLGVNPDDWAENIWGGMKYLGTQLDTFGTPELALAAYNAGPGRVKGGRVPNIKETKNYVRNITNDVDVTTLSDEELAVLASGERGGAESAGGITSCVGDSCGDALGKYLNTGPLKGTGLALPRGGIGPDTVADLGRTLGAPVYNRSNLSLESLTPGTVIHMTRKPGDKNYRAGSTHIGIVDQDEQGSTVFRSFTPGKGWRAEPVDQQFINALPAQITAANISGSALDRRMGAVAATVDVTKLSNEELAQLAAGKMPSSNFRTAVQRMQPAGATVDKPATPEVDVTKLSDEELTKAAGDHPKYGVTDAIGDLFGDAYRYVKNVLSPGVNKDLEKAKAEFLKQNPDADAATVDAAHAKLKEISAAHQMPLGEALVKNIRDFASGIIAPIQGGGKALRGVVEPMEVGVTDIQRDLGLDRRVGPGRYGTEGEGEESRGIVDQTLRPEDEKRYRGEGLVRAPGRVLGTLVPYVGAGRVAQAAGMALTPASTFYEKLLFNTATFIPVDVASGYKEAGMAGVDKALWHSPITAALFTIGGLPAGRVSGTVGVGLAGAGSAAAAGERDPVKLAEAFGTMAILHNILKTKPERATAEVKEFIKENNVSDTEVRALQDKLEALRKQYAAERATPEQRAPEPTPEEVQAGVDKLKQEYVAGEEAALVTPADLAPEVVEALRKGQPLSPSQDIVLQDKIKAALIGQRTAPQGAAWEQFGFSPEAPGLKTERTMASGAVEEGVVASQAKEQTRVEDLADEGVTPMYSGGPDTSELMRKLAPVWYSRAQRFIGDKLPNVGTGPGLANTIQNWISKGVMPGKEEVKWTGVVPWLQERKGKVTRSEVVDFLKENGVELRVVERSKATETTHKKDFMEWAREQGLDAEEAQYEWEAQTDYYETYARRHPEVNLGYEDSGGGTKFESFVKPPPGATNYREFYGVWPTTEVTFNRFRDSVIKAGTVTPKEFDSNVSFWKSQYNMEKSTGTEQARFGVDQFRVPGGHQTGDLSADINRVFHAFTWDQVIGGKKYLVIGELQSDWAGSGRRVGYKGQPATDADVKKRFSFDDKYWTDLSAEQKESFRAEVEKEGVPQFPFSKNWMEVAMKKMLRQAAEEGYDGLAWVSGDVVKERYDLSKQISKVEYFDKDGGLFAYDHSGNEVMAEYGVMPKDVEKYVGKEVADRLLKSEPKAEKKGGWVAEDEELTGKARSLSGLELKVGGEWANKQYDSINPTTGEKVFGMPVFMDKYGKQWGARVGKQEVKNKVKEYDRSVYAGRDLPEGKYGIYEPYVKDAIAYFDTEVDALKYRNKRYAVSKVDDTGRWAILDLVGEGEIGKGEVVSFYDTEKMAREYADNWNEGITEDKVHTLDITPKMKETVLQQGQYMFSGGPDTSEWFKSLFKTGNANKVLKGMTPAQLEVASRISVGDHEKKTWTTPTDIYTAIMDRYHPLRKYMEQYDTAPRPTTDDPYKQARLFEGWTGKAEAFVQYHPWDRKTFEFKQNVKGLADILKPIEKAGDIEQFRTFLVARRAVERADRGFETGVDLDAARKTVSELGEKFGEDAAQYDLYTDSVLQYARDAGLISNERYGQIKEGSTDYTPLLRVMELESKTAGGKGFTAAQVIKQFKGSEREIIDPLESTVRLTYALVNAAERNSVVDSLIRWAKESGAFGDSIHEINQKAIPIDVQLNEVLKNKEVRQYLKNSGLTEKDAVIFRPSAFQPSPNTISVWEGGERKFYNVPKEVADVVKGMSEQTAGIWMRLLSFPAQALRLGATTLSPEFGLRNFLKDQFPAFIHSKYGYKPFLDFFRGVAEIFRGGERYWQFMISGAPHGELVSMDRRLLQNKLRDVLSGKLSMPGFLVRHPIEAAKLLSAYSERGTRIGEFKKGLEFEGATPEGMQSAGYQSREVTVDFGRKGAVGKFINMITAFFNPGLQGLNKVVRAHRENLLPTMGKSIAAVTIPSMLLEAAFGDDPRYQDLPAWRKDLFFNIPTKYGVVSLPKPWTYGLLYGAVPQRIMRGILKEDPHAYDGLLEAVGKEVPDFPLPTAITPFIEIWADKKLFTGTPLMPEWKKNLPAKFQFSGYTPETMKMLGDMVSNIPVVGESWMASPVALNHLLMSWTGGTGRLFTDAMDYSLRKSGVLTVVPPPAARLADTPVVRAFFARYPSLDAEPLQRFRTRTVKSAAKMRLLTAQVMDMAMEGKQHQLLPLINELGPDTAMNLGQMLTAFNEMSKFAHLIERSKDMSPEQKRESIDKIYLSMIAAAKETNRLVDAVLEQSKRMKVTAPLKPSIDKQGSIFR